MLKVAKMRSNKDRFRGLCTSIIIIAVQILLFQIHMKEQEEIVKLLNNIKNKNKKY